MIVDLCPLIVGDATVVEEHHELTSWLEAPCAMPIRRQTRSRATAGTLFIPDPRDDAEVTHQRQGSGVCPAHVILVLLHDKTDDMAGDLAKSSDCDLRVGHIGNTKTASIEHRMVSIQRNNKA